MSIPIGIPQSRPLTLIAEVEDDDGELKTENCKLKTQGALP
jgi:hypothetical protein